MQNIITPDMEIIHNAFIAKGFDVRFVGGCVRDLVYGVEPKDIDMCTDANPLEQIDVYQSAGLKYFETGMQHGTITVVINHVPYEITSLRSETDHDGRHAIVHYTRDWVGDLARRDLTINAMSMDFDGNIYDPFNGQDDLKAGVIKFVGNADDRIKEDYLRILRYFRFYIRFGNSAADNSAALNSIRANVEGLKQISAERIWSEMQKILMTANAEHLHVMKNSGVLAQIGVDQFDTERFMAVRVNTTNFITRLVALVDKDTVYRLTSQWRFSREERVMAMWLSDMIVTPNNDYRYYMYHDGVNREWVEQLVYLNNDTFNFDEPVPTFPVTGRDLIERGYKTGAQLGGVLKDLKQQWAAMGYPETMEY